MYSKKIFRVSISIIIAVLMLTISASALAETTNNNAADELISEYNDMLDATEDFIANTFSVERRVQETASILQANQILSKLGHSEFFGGQYIGTDGKLHVMVTNRDEIARVKEAAQLNSDVWSNIIKSINDEKVVAISTDIIVEDCKYSKKQLDNIVADIGSKIDKAPYVYGYGVDEKENAVIIELKENSKDEIFMFKQDISDSPAMQFEKSPGMSVPKASLYAGTVLWPTSGSRVTITGFGYKNNQFGVITVGHALGNTLRISSTGTIVGTTQSANKVITPNADGSWTAINSGHTAYDGVAKIGSKQTNYINMGSGAPYDPVQDATVVSYLGRSAVVSQGTIVQLYWKHPVNYSAQGLGNIECIDMKVNINSQGGDSGSPLISVGYRPGSGTESILWGGLRAGTNPNNGYSRITNVATALGVDMVMG